MSAPVFAYTSVCMYLRYHCPGPTLRDLVMDWPTAESGHQYFLKSSPGDSSAQPERLS